MLNYCFAQKWREEIFLSWTINSPGFDTLLCHITTAKLYMITINIQPLALYIISVSATSLHLCLWKQNQISYFISRAEPSHPAALHKWAPHQWDEPNRFCRSVLLADVSLKTPWSSREKDFKLDFPRHSPVKVNKSGENTGKGKTSIDLKMLQKFRAGEDKIKNIPQRTTQK